jgi:hypothetical protein
MLRFQFSTSTTRSQIDRSQFKLRCEQSFFGLIAFGFLQPLQQLIEYLVIRRRQEPGAQCFPVLRPLELPVNNSSTLGLFIVTQIRCPREHVNAERLAQTVMKLFDQGIRDEDVLVAKAENRN